MRHNALWAVACLVMLVHASLAQQVLRVPDGDTKHRVPGVEVLAIPGRPFSATTSTVWTRTLEDGSTVTTRLVAALARDSRGRIYRERHSFVPSGSDAKAPLNEVHIMDPVSRSQAMCSTHAMECVIYDYSPTTFFDIQPPGPFADGTRNLSRESLGEEVIEGISVTGTRETTTIHPGAIGNDQSFVSIRESWFSEELQTNLAVTRIDAADGKQVIRLSHISMSEPDVHLFDLPIGYRVRDLRSSIRRKR